MRWTESENVCVDVLKMLIDSMRSPVVANIILEDIEDKTLNLLFKKICGWWSVQNLKEEYNLVPWFGAGVFNLRKKTAKNV